MFLHNLKAGTSSMGYLLKKANAVKRMWGVGHREPESLPELTSPPALPGWANHSRTRCVHLGSTSGLCMNASAMQSAFDLRLSVARDPVQKFESGVRQAWSARTKLKELYPTADAMLDAQLAAYAARRSRDTGEAFSSIDPLGDGLTHGKSEAEAHAILDCALTRCIGWAENVLWINEHLATTLWRFASVTADGVPLSEVLNYVGRTKRLDKAWEDVGAALLSTTAAAQAARSAAGLPLNANEEAKLKSLVSRGHALVANSRTPHAKKDAPASPRPDVLSTTGVRKMCASELFRHEWACAGYALPPECRSGRGDE